MCGRAKLPDDVSEIKLDLKIDWEEIGTYQPRWNAAPTAKLPVVISRRGERMLTMMRWGLVPFCAKDTKLVSREHQPPRPPGLKWYAPPLGAAHLIITSEESHLQ